MSLNPIILIVSSSSFQHSCPLVVYRNKLRLINCLLENLLHNKCNQKGNEKECEVFHKGSIIVKNVN